MWVKGKSRYSKGSKWHLYKGVETRFTKWNGDKYRAYMDERVPGSQYDKSRVYDPEQWHVAREGGYAWKDNAMFSEGLPRRGAICAGCLRIWLDTNSQTQSQNS